MLTSGGFAPRHLSRWAASLVRLRIFKFRLCAFIPNQPIKVLHLLVRAKPLVLVSDAMQSSGFHSERFHGSLSLTDAVIIVLK
jgi:hypothetical protein